MHENNFSDELHADLLAHNFDSRSFLMLLRQRNEKHRAFAILEHERYHPLKYCSRDNLRGFSRINKYDYSSANSCIVSHMISPNGVTIIDDLSQQLLNENLLIVRRRLQKSKTSFSSKIKSMQSDLDSQINISLKKATCQCQQALCNWISKSRWKCQQEPKK